MNVKKALWIAAAIIITVGLIVLVIALVFGTDVIQNAFNAVGNYINDFWHRLSGTDSDIFSDITVQTRETIGY